MGTSSIAITLVHCNNEIILLLLCGTSVPGTWYTSGEADIRKVKKIEILHTVREESDIYTRYVLYAAVLYYCLLVVHLCITQERVG